VKAFDVCLMPFALNEATEYINPTKTLEYMAAGKPIVSTAVADVVRNFTPIVTVARDVDEFVDSVVAAAKNPDASAIEDGITLASQSSWQSIVAKMRSLIRESVDESSILETISAEARVASTSEAESPRA
jgi:glycosyltransferase involved in cell wall biosynthesis